MLSIFAGFPNARRHRAVSDLTLHVSTEFIVLVGPTGAGKTTTLLLFAGWDAEAPREIVCVTSPRSIPRRDVLFGSSKSLIRLILFRYLAFRCCAGRETRRNPTKRVIPSRNLLSSSKLNNAPRSFPAAKCSASPTPRPCPRARPVPDGRPLSSLDASCARSCVD